MFTSVALAETSDASGAATTDTVEQMWSGFAGLIQKWLYRIAVIIAFIGGIIFFIGLGTDDHHKKILGGTMFVAGLMAFAFISFMYNFFFV